MHSIQCTKSKPNTVWWQGNGRGRCGSPEMQARFPTQPTEELKIGKWMLWNKLRSVLPTITRCNQSSRIDSVAVNPISVGSVSSRLIFLTVAAAMEYLHGAIAPESSYHVLDQRWPNKHGESIMLIVIFTCHHQYQIYTNISIFITYSYTDGHTCTVHPRKYVW